ncbi:hypothetical protein F4805DRAFT_453377 [Annulohypoxylon moriforme]|nr:hypothetical protein F4805DRAFT_453377 [Annulohypoxylon moriforme]
MCTGIGWTYRCRACSTITLKNINVSGHTCHEAVRAGKRGCCRTGIEYTFFDKVSNELCLLCEVKGEIEKINALTIGEGVSEERRGYCRAGEEGGYEEIQEYTAEQLKEWDEWMEEITSDEEDGDDEEGEEGEDDDCFSGATCSVSTAMSEDDEETDDAEEDGGAKLSQEEKKIKAEAKKKLPSWALAGSALWRRRVWSIWNR